jgi:ribosomal-protein-alanine N-acetyltransferase
MSPSSIRKFAILTTRLTLLPLSLEELQLYLEHSSKPEAADKLMISQRLMTENLERAINLKIGKMRDAEEADHLWYTYWLIQIKADGFGAGMVGFKGLPDEQGEVEIGYGMDPHYRNRGFMTEAVNALITWAFQHAECRSVIAPETERLNVASNRVLEKVGMEVYDATETTLSWRVGNPQAI